MKDSLQHHNEEYENGNFKLGISSNFFLKRSLNTSHTKRIKITDFLFIFSFLFSFNSIPEPTERQIVC